jgi:hypothetical protein
LNQPDVPGRRVQPDLFVEDVEVRAGEADDAQGHLGDEQRERDADEEEEFRGPAFGGRHVNVGRKTEGK